MKKVIIAVFILLGSVIWFACTRQLVSQPLSPNNLSAQTTLATTALALPANPFVTAYVEVGSNDIRNVGCYTFGSSNAQLFSIGNIFAANINADANGNPVLYFNTAVQAVLDSGRVAYLHALGIKVLLDILGNHQNAGWGCFTSYAQADGFAIQCANAVNQYGLDGIDIDDEYSACTSNNNSFVMAVAALRARLGSSKLITTATYNTPNYFTVVYNGQKAGDILDLIIEESYFSTNYAARMQPYLNAGIPKSKLGIGTHLVDYTDQAAVGSYVKNNGYACAMVYGVANNSQAQLTNLSNAMYNSATSVKANCIDGGGGGGFTGTHSIISVQSGLALDGGPNTQGTYPWLYGANGTNDQHWTVSASGSGYKIISVQSGLALDGGPNTQGTKPWLYGSNGTIDQQWTITASGSGYKIVSVQSGLVLDGGANTQGTYPVLNGASGTADQQWTFQ
ncbi:MAG TPA: RICIN domain-containing protein [Puia sp.]|nr:RICIN domain-containing protein [Puia sp.]